MIINLLFSIGKLLLIYQLDFAVGCLGLQKFPLPVSTSSQKFSSYVHNNISTQSKYLFHARNRSLVKFAYKYNQTI